MKRSYRGRSKLQSVRKSEKRSLNKNTFKSSHLAKILGCFGAGKWGGTSGQQNHGAQQQNYEAQPYCVKNELGFTLLMLGSTLSGLGSAFLKPGSEEQLKQVKLQFIRKSENRSLNRNTFKSGHLAKTLGCFGARKWGGTSGRQNHGAQ